MPLIRTWRRLGLAGQLGVFLSMTLVVIGALVVALVAWSNSHTTANCVNNALGARNATTLEQLAATDKFSANLATYLNTALQLQNRAAELAAFKAVSAHANEWHRAVHAAHVAATAHPLGRC